LRFVKTAWRSPELSGSVSGAMGIASAVVFLVSGGIVPALPLMLAAGFLADRAHRLRHAKLTPEQSAVMREEERWLRHLRKIFFLTLTPLIAIALGLVLTIAYLSR
jgi:hypothetical protein